MGNAAPKNKRGGAPGVPGDFHSPLEQEPVPPKPVADMNAEEKAAWDKRMAAWHKKQEMAKLVEKNLAVKASHGARPIEPPQPSSLLGKAKKAAHNHVDQAMAGKPNAHPANESLKQRIERQALASAQGSGTGGSTAALGADIAKSKMNQDLAKKREEFERKEAEKKRKEEEDRKKAQAEKTKAKPKGLKDFLNQVEGESPAPASSQPPSSPVRAQQPGLKAFLSQSEESTSAASTQQQSAQVDSNLPKKSNLQAFLSSSSPSAAADVPITSPVVATASVEPKPPAKGLQAFLATVEPPAVQSSAQPPSSPVSSPANKSNLSNFLSSPGPATVALQLSPSPVSSSLTAAEITTATASSALSKSDVAVETEQTEPAEESKSAEGFVRRASRRVSTSVKKLLGQSGGENIEAAAAAAAAEDKDEDKKNLEDARTQAPSQLVEAGVAVAVQEQMSDSQPAPEPNAIVELEGTKPLEDSDPASVKPADPAPDSDSGKPANADDSVEG